MSGTRIVRISPNYDVIPLIEPFWIVHSMAPSFVSSGDWDGSVVGLKKHHFPSAIHISGCLLASDKLAEALESRFGEHVNLLPCEVRSSEESRVYHLVGPRDFLDCVDLGATTHFHAKRRDVYALLGEPTFRGDLEYPPAFGHVHGSAITYFLLGRAILDVESEFSDIRLIEFRVSLTSSPLSEPQDL